MRFSRILSFSSTIFSESWEQREASADRWLCQHGHSFINLTSSHPRLGLGELTLGLRNASSKQFISS